LRISPRTTGVGVVAAPLILGITFDGQCAKQAQIVIAKPPHMIAEFAHSHGSRFNMFNRLRTSAVPAPEP
jgi:hypothetical protein